MLAECAVSEACTNIRHIFFLPITEENVTVVKKKPGCPAVTLLIGEPPSAISVDIILAVEGGRHNQCSSTKDGLNIERWLGKKVKQELFHEPLCLVPKNIKIEKNLIGTVTEIAAFRSG